MSPLHTFVGIIRPILILSIKKSVFLFAYLLLSLSSYSQPEGFTIKELSGNWNFAVGITFDDNGRRYVWEKGGKVYIDNGDNDRELLIDISEEAGNWGDFGLLGFALDPNFLVNGYLYLFYVVDRHHLLYFGTPDYDPFRSDGGATIGRLTRYTAVSGTNFTTVDYNSRKVLLGQLITGSPPNTSATHGVGTVMFGTDGSILLSIGDGAAPSTSPLDEGSNPSSSWEDALADGILRPDENVGAYRSQMLSSFSGKILRIHPETGEGLSTNPFFIAGKPDSIQSKIWALGLRNAYRMTLKPGTGSHHMEDGDPGIIYFGDVGAGEREELNVCTSPGQNFGWPIYEGMDFEPGYDDPQFAPDTWLTLHKLPAVDWRGGTPRASVNGVIYDVGTAEMPGPIFTGNASTGGVWYTANDFPEEYQNSYFHGDYGGQWIHNFHFDDTDQPSFINDFDGDFGAIVYITSHPIEGGLYYINYLATTLRIRRMCAVKTDLQVSWSKIFVSTC